MAVVNALPNGYLLVTLSPREAVMLMDQILDPADFPWQSNESQLVALEVKSQLKDIMQRMHFSQTEMLKAMVPTHPTEEEQREGDE